MNAIPQLGNAIEQLWVELNASKNGSTTIHRIVFIQFPSTILSGYIIFVQIQDSIIQV